MNDELDESLGITIIEALSDETAAPIVSRISIAETLTAPSILTLLASWSILSLHSSTFDLLLPHISHSATHTGGMGVPCSWLRTVTLLVSFLAAVRILRVVPFIVGKVGLLPMYRKLTLVFPALYVLVPLIGLTLNTSGAAPVVSAIVSTAGMLAKATLGGTTQVLVLLLILSAAPDASSTGTVIGALSIAELFKALAVGTSVVSFYLCESYSVVAINCALWTALATIALVGAMVARRLRETPRVGRDVPETCLVWHGLFDAEKQ